MKLSLGHSLRLTLECTVCLRNRDEDETQEGITSLMLFGLADPYAVCPMCMREVVPSIRTDADYRRRVRVTWFTKFGKVLRERSTDDGNESRSRNGWFDVRSRQAVRDPLG